MENKIIYQIYPKSFLDSNADGIGDIQGVISKLPHFKQLNVDYLWLTPVMKSPQNDNGYDISDYYQIDSIFGTKEDYVNLISKAKDYEIEIMIDLVLNHISTDHKWFQSAINGDMDYMDYFIWTDEPNELECAFGGSAWKWCSQVGKYYLHLFDETQVDLNWHNPKVRNEIYKMVNYWIDLGVSGFRLDVIDLIGKEPENNITSRGPKFKEYLKELVDNTFKGKCLTVGECWNFAPNDTLEVTGNSGLTQVFHFSHVNWIYPKWVAKNITLDALGKKIEEWQNNSRVIDTLVLNNHDLPRIQSYWFGNDLENNYYLSTLVFTLNSILRGNTYIYQGEEIGMTNNFDLQLGELNDVESINKVNELIGEGKSKNDILQLMRRVSRDNARTPFQWDDSRFAGFSTCEPWLALNPNFKKINYAQDSKNELSVFDFYKKITKFRKENYQSFSGNVKVENSNNVLKIENDNFKVLLNSNKSEVDSAESGNLLISNYENLYLKLRAYEARVYRK